MGGERLRRSGVVGYWRAVELFSPQKVPALSARERVYPVEAGRPMPWDAGHPVRAVPLEGGYGWQHVVYGGVFALGSVRDTLLDVFGESGEDHDGRMDGESALFALTVSDRGRPLLDSAVFSSCAWATGRAVAPGPGTPGWLDGFQEDADAWSRRAGALGDPVGAAAGDGDSPLGPGVVSAGHLLEFTGELARTWGVSVALDPATVRVRSVPVRLDQAEASDRQDFLNSFIAADLDRVAAALAREDPGAGLAAYLTPDSGFDRAGRVDLRLRPGAALAGVTPERTPAGRWPADARHPLALSQQFAVNAVHTELAPTAGIFAVNGPPGTGKTTMLRDCFAAVVVERARRLAALRLPSEAFERQAPYAWKSGDHTRTVTPLRPGFTGFEMVVASANNGAVENVSTEIPARAALGARWREDADYFAEQATRLLKGEPAWGAVAARLGSKRNRLEFVNRFWHGRYRRTDTGAPPPPPVPQQGRRGLRDPWIDSGSGLSHLLRQWRDTPQTGVWTEARKRFGAALAEVERLRGERADAAAAYEGLPAAYEALRHTREAVDRDTAALARAREELPPAEAALAGVRRSLEQAEEAHRAHLARRPGFSVSLFTLGRAARSWHAEEAPAAGALAAARREHDAERARVDGVRARTAAASARLDGARGAAEAARDRAARMEEALGAARERWEGFVPEGSWLADDPLRERSAPWSDPEITRARTELFLAALDLHRAFLRCTARTMYANLMAGMDAVAGTVPGTVPETHVRAAWQSLFLVVPVVSTTFASLDRVFGRLGAQALGWLFVDEAGQATPQMAVGGMWRARRTVVVGDPLQLEPVVVLPWTAQRALREEFGVAEEWAPGRTSVQRLADRANRYGTLLPAEPPDGGHEVWVGAPLRVHRRCDDPMFSVSNAVAYDGLMVQGVDAGAREPYPYRPASSWVDVVGAEADGHWIPEEGRALRRVLERLRDEGGVDLARDVFVISPFRQVVAGARRACRDLVPDGRVGTVHTTQGKEADVVVLVLGTDPRRPGARAWAASRPNLLNVAVSRAKRRLFVIGNRDAWRDQRYFSTLAESLPSHSWSPSGRGEKNSSG
ncbi:DEAD/DEAH box helicase [Streptomyces lavendulae]|uniref:DEAD/DEAH box helicase n=1 Tax=Streptomyces lavendulae TaxID=1914 RepID=UPI0024A10019|nr:AAA domain-containing protein [Streptomyces lavendulae]GLX17240.1 DNA helicase [Streptomyces lavendulae subsp. lavendulae]GLX24901.1 DNA helicase [Streptomyces lavendulae subsp. lavendulae]